MSVRILKAAVVLFAVSVPTILPSPVAAQPCSRSALPAAAERIVPTKNPDQTIFNRAVLAEVNYFRCKAGVSPLKLASGLITVARVHADWMAKRSKLSHKSTVRGQSSVQERVLASGVNARRGSENIGNLPRYQFGGSGKIFINSISRCDFSTPSGQKIPPHNYASLANEIVGKWMASADHRRNVLDSNMNTVGTALDFNKKGSPCGQFYLSQNFAG